jgi:hypothetical protein
MQTDSTTALELRRDASVAIPNEITIPATIEDASFVLEGVGALAAATLWGTAAIVYAFTAEDTRGSNQHVSKVKDALGLVEFAELEIRGLSSYNTVRKYRRAWQWAINEGIASVARPGNVVELPTIPFKEISDPHVANNSGENEWYTPPEYVEPARWVMGAIDLDPASSKVANEIIQAEKFYSLEDDGLEQPWRGRVWLNPPYAGELVGRFAEKLAKHVDNGDVTAAVVLVNNATETDWFRTVIRRASAICFPDKRVKFLSPEGELGAPLQGQAILYIGTDIDAFIEAYSPIGWLGIVHKGQEE